ncbi:uncharacterized protein LOC127737984 [Mytilus californianus]|uniref:uncharacterized protein LOC127737984 n=1 Tax=Mytilus californianus TaxID=6549 RepID=UPI00224572B7|nr:uncharacterized protein LOC127737984 [Mytilus californianus]
MEVEVYIDNYQTVPSVLWQYYADIDGDFVEYPDSNSHQCDKNGNIISPLTEDWFAVKHTKTEKNLVIVYDVGSNIESTVDSQGRKFSEVVKEAIKQTLQTLTPNDKVNIIAFNGTAQITNMCKNKLFIANQRNKDILSQFVTTMGKPGGRSDYSVGLEAAYKILETENADKQGLNITIRPTGVSNQNGIVYFFPDLKGFPTGVAKEFTSSIPFTVNTDKEYTVIAPVIEDKLGLKMTISVPVIDKLSNNSVTGTAAVDVSMATMFTEIEDFELGVHSYAFLLEKRHAHVLLHPKLKDPANTIHDKGEDDIFPSIQTLEPNLSQEQIKKITTEGKIGSFSAKLSPSVFVDSEVYKFTEENLPKVGTLSDFLSGRNNTNIIKEGIKKEIWHSLIETQSLIDYWRNSRNKAIERFFGSPSGVFKMYPGVALSNTFDHIQYKWYKKSVARNQDLVFTSGRISEFTTKDVMILSRALSENMDSKDPGTVTSLQGVVGATLTHSQLTAMLINNVDDCTMNGLECHIIDNNGYFLTFGTERQNGKYKSHLTQKFPWLASQLIRKNLLKHVWCTSMSEGNHELSYSIQIPVIEHDVGAADVCRRYVIGAVNGTNLFILVVNGRGENKCTESKDQTEVCESCGATYAKCSQCINGNQLTCQCPCYCEVDFDQCSSQFNDTNSTTFPHSACYYEPLYRKLTEFNQPKPVISCKVPCQAIEEKTKCRTLVHCKWDTTIQFPLCVYDEVTTTATPTRTTRKLNLPTKKPNLPTKKPNIPTKKLGLPTKKPNIPSKTSNLPSISSNSIPSHTHKVPPKPIHTHKIPPGPTKKIETIKPPTPLGTSIAGSSTLVISPTMNIVKETKSGYVSCVYML